MLASVAEPVDVALRQASTTVAIPAVEAHRVDLPVTGIHAGTVDAGEGVDFQFHNCRLVVAIDFLQHHVVQPAFAEAGVEQSS